MNETKPAAETEEAVPAVNPDNVPPNPLFRLVIIASAAFVITILLLLATTFSSSKSSLKQLLDLYGLQLIGVELATILVSGFFAMALDRRQTLAKKAELDSEAADADSNSSVNARPND